MPCSQLSHAAGAKEAIQGPVDAIAAVASARSDGDIDLGPRLVSQDAARADESIDIGFVGRHLVDDGLIDTVACFAAGVAHADRSKQLATLSFGVMLIPFAVEGGL